VTLQIQVHGRGFVVTDALRKHAVLHIRFALSRFGAEVRRATLELAQGSNPAAESGQHCRVEVRFRRGGSVVIEDFDANVYAAISRAAERAGRAASRTLAHLSDIERDSRPRGGGGTQA
jgi:ribosome-associated translation inhibitor RaiA